MIQVRMLKTFNTRYGFRRAGELLWSEEDYIKALAPGMVEVIRNDDEPLQPSRVQSFERAPLTKDRATEPPSSLPATSAEVATNGAEKPSPSSRAGRRSPKPMPIGAARDAK
jgi:hypothetical protein